MHNRTIKYKLTDLYSDKIVRTDKMDIATKCFLSKRNKIKKKHLKK